MDKKMNIGIIASVALLAVGTYFLIRDRKQNTNTNNNTTMATDPRLPRGYRNNNPLNIRYNANNNWQGKVLPNTDGTFEQFISPAYGYRAALKLIRNYIGAGYNTVSAIIGRWAPTNENNTSGYINRVCQTTGYLPATIIEVSDKNKLCNLVYAMAIVENGVVSDQPVMAEIEEGWRLL